LHVRTLVLGLGNPILTDDGVGIQVVRRLAARVAHSESTNPDPDLTLAEASVGGLRLLDALAGYERVILVDAIQTAEGRPGAVYRLHPGDLLASRHSGSSHDLTLPAALDLGRRVGMALPRDEDISILAVEVDDVLTFGEECTPAVAAAIPAVVQMVGDDIATGQE
jgi:hydrogenase maturation protease